MRAETSRLVLREYTCAPADLASLHRLESDPDVVRYQTWEPMSEERAANFLQRIVAAQSASPRTVYEVVVELKGANANQFLGRVGLKLDAEARKAEMWYSFLPSVQGKGYATEALQALVAQFPDLESLEIECDPRNEGSKRLAQRLGFKQVSYVEDAFESKGERVGSIVFSKVLK